MQRFRCCMEQPYLPEGRFLEGISLYSGRSYVLRTEHCTDNYLRHIAGTVLPSVQDGCISAWACAVLRSRFGRVGISYKTGQAAQVFARPKTQCSGFDVAGCVFLLVLISAGACSVYRPLKSPSPAKYMAWTRYLKYQVPHVK